MFAVSGLAAWATHSVVRDQGRRLLKERAGEVSLLFTSSVGGVTNSFNSYIAVLRVTGYSPNAFAKAAAADTSQAAASKPTIAVVRREGAGFRVVTAYGPALKANQQPSATTLLCWPSGWGTLSVIYLSPQVSGS